MSSATAIPLALSDAAATLLAGVAALMGASIATFVGFVHNSRATFFQALEWLSGGTQRRSLGIATVEAVWRRRGSIWARVFGNYDYFRDLSIPILESAAVYLLLTKDQPLEAHEQRNLRRIMDLLLEVKGPERERHASVFDDLSLVLDQAALRLDDRASQIKASARQGEASRSVISPDVSAQQLENLRKDARSLLKSVDAVTQSLEMHDESDATAVKELAGNVREWGEQLSPSAPSS